MEFLDRVQPGMEKLFTMSHLKNDTKAHLKKVYSALTLTLMAAAAGSVLAIYVPILSNGFVNLIAGIYLLFSLASRQGTNRERLVKMLGFGAVTGAGLRPLLNLTIRVNPNIMPTAFILCSSIFICFSLMSLMTKQRSLLYLGSMLFSALSAMFWINISNMFIGSSGLSDLTLYGGVMVMSGFVCYDTQMIVARFEMGDRDFIYHSIDLFLDFIHLFRKLLIILTKKEENNKRRRN
jgi:FtsH-binding integral membrane protein